MPGGPIMDGNHLYRLRRETAEGAARQKVLAERGQPETDEEEAQFEAEVKRLVKEWTAGWEMVTPKLGLRVRWRRDR